MNNIPYGGIICAAVTPFISPVGEVDYEWVPHHLRLLQQQGVHGVLTGGTTGEGPSLALEERRALLATVLAHRGNLLVVAGTGCAALQETVQLSRFALEQGADALLLMPPFFWKTIPDGGMLRYFRALCDELPADARLLLYHIPALTGVAISRELIEGLLESHSGQFFGIKDSSGNAAHTAELVQRYPMLRIYSGSDSQLATSLAAGVYGAISALANTWPARVRAVYDAHTAGSSTDAAQQQLNAVRRLLNVPNLPPLLKAALPLVSTLPRTSVRAPLTNLSDDEVALLRQALARLA